MTKTYDVIGDLPEEQDVPTANLMGRLERARARQVIYLHIAVKACSRETKCALSPPEYLLLSLLVFCADADLSGSFPSAAWLATQTNYNPRYLRRILQALVNKGWVRRATRRLKHGGLRSAVNQFCVPAGALAEGAPEWVGP